MQTYEEAICWNSCVGYQGQSSQPSVCKEWLDLHGEGEDDHADVVKLRSACGGVRFQRLVHRALEMRLALQSCRLANSAHCSCCFTAPFEFADCNDSPNIDSSNVGVGIRVKPAFAKFPHAVCIDVPPPMSYYRLQFHCPNQSRWLIFMEVVGVPPMQTGFDTSWLHTQQPSIQEFFRDLALPGSNSQSTDTRLKNMFLSLPVLRLHFLRLSRRSAQMDRCAFSRLCKLVVPLV